MLQQLFLTFCPLLTNKGAKFAEWGTSGPPTYGPPTSGPPTSGPPTSGPPVLHSI